MITIDKNDSVRKINKLQSYINDEINFNTKRAARMSLIIKIATSLGLSISELLDIKVKDIGDTHLNISRRNNKIDSLKIDDELYSILNTYVEKFDLQEEDYLFKGRNGKMTDEALHKIFNSYSNKIGEKVSYQHLKNTCKYFNETNYNKENKINNEHNKYKDLDKINSLLFKYMAENNPSEELRNAIIYLHQISTLEKNKNS